MLDKRELLEAIEHCEDHLHDFKDCARLASLYAIYDHNYGKKRSGEPIYELIIQTDCSSEFLSAINGKNANDIWIIIDSLMQDLSESNIRLYEHIMSKL